MADAHEPDAVATPMISIDRKSYRVSAAAMTGAELLELATPAVPGDYDLILLRPGHDDLFVRPDEIVELSEGEAFITVPPRILAGRCVTPR
jgi:hypothetical protein